MSCKFFGACSEWSVGLAGDNPARRGHPRHGTARHDAGIARRGIHGAARHRIAMHPSPRGIPDGMAWRRYARA